MNKKGYEGLQEEIRRLALPAVETWRNQYPDRDYKVSFETAEFTCLCPKTGLPDFAKLIVEYCPGELCVELKSFKEYLLAFRDVGVFHEHVVNRVLEDLTRGCRPRWMKVQGVFNVRGGITTTVEAEYRDETARGVA